MRPLVSPDADLRQRSSWGLPSLVCSDASRDPCSTAGPLAAPRRMAITGRRAPPRPPHHSAARFSPSSSFQERASLMYLYPSPPSASAGGRAPTCRPACQWTCQWTCQWRVSGRVDVSEDECQRTCHGTGTGAGRGRVGAASRGNRLPRQPLRVPDAARHGGCR